MMRVDESPVAVFPETIGLRTFARNFPAIRRKIAKGPVMVVRNSSPDFVAVSPKRYQQLCAAAEELRWARLFESTVQARKENSKLSWATARRRLLRS